MSATLGILFAITVGPAGGTDDPSPLGLEDVIAAPTTARQVPRHVDDALPDGFGSAGPDIIIRERIIIRVPSRRAPEERAAPQVDREPAGKGPRCIPIAPIRAAFPYGDGGLLVDLGRRGLYWAGLGRGCRSMDFHGGIYIAPARDGLFCARRDLLRGRSGASCMVSRFVDMP